MRGTSRLLYKALRTRFVDGRPFILSHLLSARCNADCATCLWKMPADSRADELSTGEARRLYRDAAEAGFLALVMWGGEPMVRADAGELLQAAHEAGLDTTLITNGWFLDERAHEVVPWTDRLIVSVDAVGERHDRIRRCPGLFARIERGLGHLRAEWPEKRVLIACVLSKLNDGELEAVAAFGKRCRARVVFQQMNWTDYGFSDRSLDERALRIDPQRAQALAAEIRALRARGYPVRDSDAYLSRFGRGAPKYRCHYKKVVLRVEPNGDVLDCTRVAAPMVNVRTARLRDFVGSAAFRDFTRRALACNRCNDAGVLEASHIWEGRPAAIWNAVRGLG